MKKIQDITIEQESKNILVTYIDTENNITFRKGYNSLVKEDWEAIDLEPELSPYKDLAWKDFEKPED